MNAIIGFIEKGKPFFNKLAGNAYLQAIRDGFLAAMPAILFSSIFFGIWPVTNAWLRTAVHLLLLPLVVGVTYEFNRWVGRHDNPVTRVLTAPGMWLQNFTTNEPDDSMIQCAIRSLELVLPDEQGKDEW